ncbi:restriction endonuclease subunit S [Reyranella sp.]|uniref:restriction endonuclease subunit S n=1 Tax=Reyranella sp. TaxID=1929291 RepID=UPI003F706C48
MNPEQLLVHYEKIADAPDAIARLRRFILDLAVRGKLVPQEVSDESASELLRKIADERMRLVKSAEIRKPKALPEIQESPFVIPPSWRWTRIRDVTSDRGQTVPDAEFTYIDVTAIDKENGIVADPKVISADVAPSRARKITRKGDVIYSCVRPYLLNVAIIDEEFTPPPIASTAFAVLNGYGLVMPRYIWIALRSPFMVEHVERSMRGQAYPAINDADFAVLPFPVPPLPEQHRIVAKVDELMALCDQLEKSRTAREERRDRLTAASLARLNDPTPKTFQTGARFALDAFPVLTTRPDQIKRLRQTILNLAVRGKLVPQDHDDEPAAELLKRIAKEKARMVKAGEARKLEVDTVAFSEEPFAVPQAWTWTRLGSIGDWGSGSTPPRGGSGLYGGHITWLKSGELNDNRALAGSEETVTEAAVLKSSFRLNKPGDVLIAMYGATIGRVAILAEDAVTNQAVCGCTPFPGVSNQFLFLFLLSQREQFHSVSEGGAQPNISKAKIVWTPFPLPPLVEQHRIVTKVDELMALCDRLEASLAAGETARSKLLDALLHEALEPSVDRLEAAA